MSDRQLTAEDLQHALETIEGVPALALLTGGTIDAIEGYKNDHGYTVIRSITVSGVKVELTISNGEAAVWWAEKAT